MARPGTRAPHLYVEHAGKRISTLDLFGRNFVFLAGSEAKAWRDAASAAAQELEIDLDIYAIEADAFPNAFGIAASGAVLVRPDGFVAWRAKSDQSVSRSALLEPLRAILKV